jgi:hypothetical protein
VAAEFDRNPGLGRVPYGDEHAHPGPPRQMRRQPSISGRFPLIRCTIFIGHNEAAGSSDQRFSAAVAPDGVDSSPMVTIGEISDDAYYSR